MFPCLSVLFFIWYPSEAVQVRVLPDTAAFDQCHSLMCERSLGGY
jgi:hypothetical protein